MWDEKDIMRELELFTGRLEVAIEWYQKDPWKKIGLYGNTYCLPLEALLFVLSEYGFDMELNDETAAFLRPYGKCIAAKGGGASGRDWEEGMPTWEIKDIGH